MGDDGRGTADNPVVITPPPFIYAGGLAAGLLANRRFRLPFLPRRLALTLGPLLIVGGFAVGQLGFREMRRAGTHVGTRTGPRRRSSPGAPTALRATRCTSGSR
jgi:hypothetical protein